MSKNSFMRCLVCSHGTDLWPDQPFVELEVQTQESEYRSVFIMNDKQVKLLACPKCGSVRVIADE